MNGFSGRRHGNQEWVRGVTMKMARTSVCAVLALLAVASCGSASEPPIEKSNVIESPNDLAAKFQSGAQDGKYVFYAPAGKVPDWKSVAAAGIFICSENRPPLIPQKERDMIDAGGFPPGTELAMQYKDVTDDLGIKQLIVTVPAAVKGCTEVALTQMSETPGMLLMIDANASFDEKDKLMRVLLQ